jgi:parallel beta-helix repeat protein
MTISRRALLTQPKKPMKINLTQRRKGDENGSVLRSGTATWLIAAALLSIINARFSTTCAQGSLTPPGPPGPTMLSLTQVEPRTPVDPAHTPGSGAFNFIIGSSGSYYFTMNIAGVSGKGGMEINANDVTLDLNGFSVTGSSGSATAILVNSGYTNVVVRNGTIIGWGNGVLVFANNAVIEDLQISTGGFCAGLNGDGDEAKNCIFANGTDAGIQIQGTNAVVSDCLVQNNFYGINIVTGSADVLVRYNNCTGNTGPGIFCQGSGCRIEANHVIGSGDTGIETFTPGTNNIIIRNSVEGEGINDFSINGPTILGPIITNTVSGIITNSNPWANFAF